MRILSIIIPAYNEEASIGTLLEKIDQVDLESVGVSKEVIVVDDCSSDRTGEIAKQHKNVSYYLQPENRGKGSAVKRGISVSTGDWVLVQDADLEYEPNDYIPMVEKASHDPEQTSIYGKGRLYSLRKESSSKANTGIRSSSTGLPTACLRSLPLCCLVSGSPIP